MTTTQVFTLICSSIAVVGMLLAMLWLHLAERRARIKRASKTFADVA